MSGVNLVAILAFVLSVFGIHQALLHSLGLPDLKDPSHPDVQAGTAASGTLAWEHVAQMCQRPHEFNSNENLKVRKYLLNTLQDLEDQYDTWNCSFPNPFQVFHL